MSWVKLPRSVALGCFRFSLVNTDDPAPVFGAEIAGTVAKALQVYVDHSGKPIEGCTVLLRPRHIQAWNIPERLWEEAKRVAEILALACLAEQRFFEGHFSPHLNASMFSLVGQGITAGSDNIGLFYPRRGGSLVIGGLRFKDVLVQRSPQVEGTACEIIGTRPAKALNRACQAKHPVWEPITSSLEVFLLGHAETPELGWDTCVILSAIAFERLLEPNKPTGQRVAEAFTTLWGPYAACTINRANRVRPDPTYAKDQQTWPLHRKWMKELYEARSSQAHRGLCPNFSENWNAWQHMVIAAFVYPFTVKLRLATVGLYQLSDTEQGACHALDKLLDGDWGKGWRTPPEWSGILSKSEDSRALRDRPPLGGLG